MGPQRGAAVRLRAALLGMSSAVARRGGVAGTKRFLFGCVQGDPPGEHLTRRAHGTWRRDSAVTKHRHFGRL